MKTMLDTNTKKVPAIRIEPALDRYDNIVLFPEKLAKANKQVKKSGSPDSVYQKQKHQSKIKKNTKK